MLNKGFPEDRRQTLSPVKLTSFSAVSLGIYLHGISYVTLKEFQVSVLLRDGVVFPCPMQACQKDYLFLVMTHQGLLKI